MNRILQLFVTPFLRRYWWIWLSLFVVAVIVMIIGPSVVGKFIYGVFGFILWITFLGIGLTTLWCYTFGRGIIEMWGWLRLMGIGGFVGCSFVVYVILSNVPFSEILWKQEHAVQKGNLILFFGLAVFSVFLVGFGEMLLYLHKMNYKLKQAVLPPKLEMICPRCFGKGYVDHDDICRLDMAETWLPGMCSYCDAQGHVERGKPAQINPTHDAIQTGSLKNIFGDEQRANMDFEKYQEKYEDS